MSDPRAVLLGLVDARLELAAVEQLGVHDRRGEFKSVALEGLLAKATEF